MGAPLDVPIDEHRTDALVLAELAAHDGEATKRLRSGELGHVVERPGEYDGDAAPADRAHLDVL